MHPFLKVSAIAAVALLSVAGCRVMHNEETAGQYVDDTTISARAKAALIKDSNVKSSDFSIEVRSNRRAWFDDAIEGLTLRIMRHGIATASALEAHMHP